MGLLIEYVARLIEAGRRAYARKWNFFGLFVLVFLGSAGLLAKLDLLPEVPSAIVPIATHAALQAETPAASAPAVVETPTHVEAAAIGLSATVANPASADVATLDTLLLSGSVRYPTSALLGEEGNVVLFGHSSYLPVVGNQAYKTFNGIQKLAVGDAVTVSSDTTAYTYRVRSVAKESAADNTAIPLQVSGKTLTLVTCNSFGEKSDRFVVTADFVESHSISS